MLNSQWINESEIESGYFWEVPEDNALIRLWVIDAAIPDKTWLSKVIARQSIEKENTWIWAKIWESFTWGIERIQEAGEWLATGKFNIAEAFIRWWAWSLQSFFSPVAWLIGEGVEEGIQALSDDFKENVTEAVSPTVQSVVKWYQDQSPEQQRNLDNIGVWLEVLLELVWWNAIKQPLWEILWSTVTWTKKLIWEWVESLTEGLTSTKSVLWDILPSKQDPDVDLLESLWLATEKGKIWDMEVDIPVVDRSISENIVAKFTNVSDKQLAGKAVSPRTIWKNSKQKLQSIADVEINTKQFYDNVRTGILDGDIDTLENAAQTIVNNIDTVGARIWNAVKQVDWTIEIDNQLTDDIITALWTKWAEVSPATPILQKFFDSLWDGTLSIDEAYELKKAYSNEITKLYKWGDAGTKQYKALNDWVKFLNTKIDEIIDTKLWSEFANDKILFRQLKTLVDDMVASALVEGRSAPFSLAERIWQVESIFSPVNSVKQKLIKTSDDLNKRGWAWAELIKRYDEASIKNLWETK